jgi:hypothetical protein
MRGGRLWDQRADRLEVAVAAGGTDGVGEWLVAADDDASVFWKGLAAGLRREYRPRYLDAVGELTGRPSFRLSGL